jgi:hypothetical protein
MSSDDSRSSIKKYCPFRIMTINEGPTSVCIKESCAWWRTLEKCCSVHSIAMNLSYLVDKGSGLDDF